MKNWIRIFLICLVLAGGTVFFSYWSFNRFNNALNNLSASYIAIIKTPNFFSDKTNKKEISTTTPENISTTTPDDISTTTPDDISTLATLIDSKLFFIFPKKDSEVYIGCTYPLSWQSSTTISLLEIVLVDAGSKKTIEPAESGLVKENEIEPDSQSLDWKVGVVWPGQYFILISKVNSIEKEIISKSFMIYKMPKGISADEKEEICKESGGSFS